MLKNRIIAVVTSIALLMAATTLTGVVADSLGYLVTSQVHACNTGSHSGGGC